METFDKILYSADIAPQARSCSLHWIECIRKWWKRTTQGNRGVHSTQSSSDHRRRQKEMVDEAQKLRKRLAQLVCFLTAASDLVLRLLSQIRKNRELSSSYRLLYGYVGDCVRLEGHNIHHPC